MKNVKKNIYADMDPIEEIRAIRADLNRRFPTAQALGEYLRKAYPNPRPANWVSPPPLPPLPKLKPRSRRTAVKTVKRSAPRHRKASAHA
ncbi:MAG: hypothetical protein FWD53_02170 [Phycisphaerales bacterium]|nr:hypothetical protein [Phycisphaerales bacterium]